MALPGTLLQVGGAAVLGFGGVLGFLRLEPPAGLASHLAPSPACVIKGNISIGSGRHIYHLPGHRYYNETVISPQYGERWFCSEAEAQAAGWEAAEICAAR